MQLWGANTITNDERPSAASGWTSIGYFEIGSKLEENMGQKLARQFQYTGNATRTVDQSFTTHTYQPHVGWHDDSEWVLMNDGADTVPESTAEVGIWGITAVHLPVLSPSSGMFGRISINDSAGISAQDTETATLSGTLEYTVVPGGSPASIKELTSSSQLQNSAVYRLGWVYDNATTTFSLFLNEAVDATLVKSLTLGSVVAIGRTYANRAKSEHTSNAVGMFRNIYLFNNAKTALQMNQSAPGKTSAVFAWTANHNSPEISTFLPKVQIGDGSRWYLVLDPSSFTMTASLANQVTAGSEMTLMWTNALTLVSYKFTASIMVDGRAPTTVEGIVDGTSVAVPVYITYDGLQTGSEAVSGDIVVTLSATRFGQAYTFPTITRAASTITTLPQVVTSFVTDPAHNLPAGFRAVANKPVTLIMDMNASNGSGGLLWTDVEAQMVMRITSTNADNVHDQAVVWENSSASGLSINFSSQLITFTYTATSPITPRTFSITLLGPDGTQKTLQVPSPILATEVLQFPTITNPAQISPGVVAKGQDVTITTGLTPFHASLTFLNPVVTPVGHGSVSPVASIATASEGTDYEYTMTVDYDADYSGTFELRYGNIAHTYTWASDTILTADAHIYTVPSTIYFETGIILAKDSPHTLLLMLTDGDRLGHGMSGVTVTHVYISLDGTSSPGTDFISTAVIDTAAGTISVPNVTITVSGMNIPVQVEIQVGSYTASVTGAVPANQTEIPTIEAHASRILDLKVTDPTNYFAHRPMCDASSGRVTALKFNAQSFYDPPWDIYGPKPQDWNYHEHGQGDLTQPTASQRPHLDQWKYWSHATDRKMHSVIRFEPGQSLLSTNMNNANWPGGATEPLNTVKTIIFTSKWNYNNHPNIGAAYNGLNYALGVQYWQNYGMHPTLGNAFTNNGPNSNMNQNLSHSYTLAYPNRQRPLFSQTYSTYLNWNNVFTTDPNDGSLFLFDLESKSLDTVAQVPNPTKWNDVGPIPRLYHMLKENILVMRVSYEGSSAAVQFRGTNHIARLGGHDDKHYAGNFYEMNHYSDHLTDAEILSEVQRIRQFWLPEYQVVSTPAQVVFTSSGTWSVPTGVTHIQILAIGGGGSGGPRGVRKANGARLANAYQSGGGAGGVVHIQDWDVSPLPSSLTITVGQGGNVPADYASITANNGEDTVVTCPGKGISLVAKGGGHGGYWHYSNDSLGGSDNGPQLEPGDGGSGGGRTKGDQNYTTTFGQGTQPQDTNDGSTVYPNTGFGNDGGGQYGTNRGGGGARFAGNNYGTPGDGMYFGHIFGTAVGDGGWFAMGGASSNSTAPGIHTNANTPPFGGGGKFHDGNPAHGDVANGMAGTGSGGGGSGNGARGVVIIRYWTSDSIGLPTSMVLPNVGPDNPVPMNQSFSCDLHMQGETGTFHTSHILSVELVQPGWPDEKGTFTMANNEIVVSFGTGIVTSLYNVFIRTTFATRDSLLTPIPLDSIATPTMWVTWAADHSSGGSDGYTEGNKVWAPSFPNSCWGNYTQQAIYGDFVFIMETLDTAYPETANDVGREFYYAGMMTRSDGADIAGDLKTNWVLPAGDSSSTQWTNSFSNSAFMTDNVNNRIASLQLNYRDQRYVRFKRTGDQFSISYSSDNVVWYTPTWGSWNSNLWVHYNDGVKTDVTGNDGIIFWAGTSHFNQSYTGHIKWQEHYDGSQSWRLLYLAQN